MLCGSGLARRHQQAAAQLHAAGDEQKIISIVEALDTAASASASSRRPMIMVSATAENCVATLLRTMGSDRFRAGFIFCEKRVFV